MQSNVLSIPGQRCVSTNRSSRPSASLSCFWASNVSDNGAKSSRFDSWLAAANFLAEEYISLPSSVECHDCVEVSTLCCGRVNRGSNLGHAIGFPTSLLNAKVEHGLCPLALFCWKSTSR